MTFRVSIRFLKKRHIFRMSERKNNGMIIPNIGNEMIQKLLAMINGVKKG